MIKELSKNNILISGYKKFFNDASCFRFRTKIINDVSSLNYDKNTLKLLKIMIVLCLTHSKETPQTMQNNPIYNNVVCDIYNFFKKIKCIKKNEYI